MKKNIIIFALLSLVLASCSHMEENLFDKNASVRAREAMDNASNAFLNAPSGWVMYYYPNQERCGYNILMRFKSDETVVCATANDLTTRNHYEIDSLSTWEIINDYGPVLTFNTYNDVFHAFSDPLPDGVGVGGDYEFLILESSEDFVRLKGKKYEAYCEMHRLPAGTDWKAYCEQIQKMDNLTFYANEEMTYNVVFGGQTIAMQNNNRVLSYGDGDKTYYRFVITPDGIQFYDQGMLLGGSYARNFRLNDAQDALVCTDAVDAKIVAGYTVTEYLALKLNQQYRWDITADGHGTTSQAAYDLINAGLTSTGATLSRIAFQSYNDGRLFRDALFVEFYDEDNVIRQGLIGLSTSYGDDDILEIELGENISNMSFVDGGAMTEFLIRITGSNDTSAKNLAKGRRLLSDLVAGTFKVTSVTGSSLNPQKLYFTSTADSNVQLNVEMN